METVCNSVAGIARMSPMELQDGVASLSRGAYFREAPLDMILSILTESAARMSGIERVSIWALTDDHSELRCLELFELTPARHGRGEVLSEERYPGYFTTLRAEACIAADDVYLHPSTAELAIDYLPRHNISASLDTAIYIRGELQGVLRLEQVGPCRQPWLAEHRLFAHAVANLVTLALVEYEADEARQQAQRARERLQAVFDASRDALLLTDGDSGLIIDANRQAEHLFGCQRDDLVGKHQRQLHPATSADEAGERFTRIVAGQGALAQTLDIQCSDGSVRPVEITTEVADLSDGRRLALGIFRPV
nr:PAS domain S-box protein [Dechloromonas sp.]